MYNPLIQIELIKENMRIYGDYHTHTKYSDGVTNVIDNLSAAREKGLESIGITDHGYASPSFGGLTREKFIKQKKEIESLRDQFGDLNIYHGIEANITGIEGNIDLREEDFSQLDYIIAGFHAPARPYTLKSFGELYLNSYFSFVIKPSRRVIERNTRAYISMIKKYPIAIIAHINHLTKVDALEIAKCCADYGTMIELNAKHVELSYSVFEKILMTDVKLIANTDGHKKTKIGRFEEIEKYIKGYPEAEARIINSSGIIDFRKPKYYN